MEETSVFKVFLSGRLESDWQKKVMTEVPGCMYFNPQSHGIQSPQQYAVWDMHYIKNADIIFAYMENDNPSGYGLATEVGYANGLGKTIILVDEKSKENERFKLQFAIVRELSSVVFDSLNDGIALLKKFANNA